MTARTNSNSDVDTDAVISVEWIRGAVTVINSDDATIRIGRDVQGEASCRSGES